MVQNYGLLTTIYQRRVPPPGDRYPLLIGLGGGSLLNSKEHRIVCVPHAEENNKANDRKSLNTKNVGRVKLHIIFESVLKWETEKRKLFVGKSLVTFKLRFLGCVLLHIVCIGSVYVLRRVKDPSPKSGISPPVSPLTPASGERVKSTCQQ